MNGHCDLTPQAHFILRVGSQNFADAKSFTPLAQVVKAKSDVLSDGSSRDFIVDRGDGLILIVVRGDFAGAAIRRGSSP